MKSLTSLLAALSVYLLLLGAVLYSYRSRPHPAVAESSRRTEIITLGIIGESGTQKGSHLSAKTPKMTTKNPPIETKKTLEEKSTRKPISPNKTASLLKPTLPTEEKRTATVKTETKPIPVLKPLPLPSKRTLEKVTPVDPVRYIALKRVPAHTQKILHKKKTKKTKHTTRSRSRRVRGSGTGRRISASKNSHRFLYALKKRINRNKRYPRIARRRGITGAVRVSFTILPSGTVGSISVKGSKAFYRSAKYAVRGAFPVNPAKASHPLPWRITVALRYQLR